MATKQPSRRSTGTSSAAKRAAVKKVARAAKRHKGATLAIVIVIIVLIAVGAVLYLKVPAVHDKVDSLIAKVTGADKGTNLSGGGGTSDPKTTPDAVPHADTYGTDDLTFHFLELGNNYTGDCTYIKAGDVDILIDAGSREGSAATIKAYVDGYCTDGKLEYVIATHAHQDHIAGFVKSGGIFANYECGVIIDFALTNATSAVYNNYIAARDAEVEAGAKHFTALECYNESKAGAQRTYSLGEGMSMTILYQEFYENETLDENDYSVCVLFNHGSNYYLFTGDLEAAGEASLVSHNDLPEVELFKAGHHGSYTASSETLLAEIRPKIVCVCCCADSTENGALPENRMPAQAFVNRVALYTDCVYVTTRVSTEEEQAATGKKYASYNGNIVVLCHPTETEIIVSVNCSNNNTKLKDSEWFKAHRTWPPNGVSSSG